MTFAWFCCRPISFTVVLLYREYIYRIYTSYIHIFTLVSTESRSSFRPPPWGRAMGGVGRGAAWPITAAVVLDTSKYCKEGGATDCRYRWHNILFWQRKRRPLHIISSDPCHRPLPVYIDEALLLLWSKPSGGWCCCAGAVDMTRPSGPRFSLLFFTGGMLSCIEWFGCVGSSCVCVCGCGCGCGVYILLYDMVVSIHTAVCIVYTLLYVQWRTFMLLYVWRWAHIRTYHHTYSSV